MNDIDVLDCTFRDGGYYTNWDFEEEIVNRYLKALERLGINLVELGFFSNIASDYRGPHYYSRSGLLDRVSIPNTIRVGVMINASEFSTFVDHADFEQMLSKLDDRLSFVRLACHHHELDMMHAVVPILNRAGLDVGINLMKMEEAPPKLLKQLVEVASNYAVKWLYLADSFGSCTPSMVQSKFKSLREFGWSGLMGFHAHDNCGLAMTNVFAAIDGGVGLVDSTVLGMGRGPGNVKTEQLAAAMRLNKGVSGESSEDFLGLYELIEDYFRPLQERKKWGSSIPYAVSALAKIHPSFGQEMIRQSYPPVSVISSLVRIGNEGGAYSKDILDCFGGERTSSINLHGKGAGDLRRMIKGGIVVIVGSGESSCSSAQLEVIKNRGGYVIGLNIPGAVSPELCDLLAVSQPVRLDQVLKFNPGANEPPLLLPEAVGSLEQSSRLIKYGLELSETVVIRESGCLIPETVVVAYALSFAISCWPSEILMVGVSGFGLDHEEHHRTQRVLKALFESAAQENILVCTAGSNSFDLPEVNLDVYDERA